MEKVTVDIWQLLWGLNTLLLGIMLFLYRDLKKEIEKRTLIIACEQIHKNINAEIHTHASVGTAGEVVKK
jgi:hypothetical protein